jgi:uncharacterized protein
MTKVFRWLTLTAAVALAAGVAALAWHVLTKPTTLTIAVGPGNSEDAQLAAAWARVLSAEAARVRLTVVPTSGPVEALKKLDSKEAQLAIVRSDGNASNQVRGVAILHKDLVVILAASEPKKIENFGDLKRKALGVIGPPNANDALIATLRRQYGIKEDELTLVQLAVGEGADAFRHRRVAAILFTNPHSSGAAVGDRWAAAPRAAKKGVAILELKDADALAATNPGYEAGEIKAGTYRGSPAIPEEDTATLELATYLVAGRSVPDDAVARVTRSLFETRQKIAAEAPIVKAAEAASTDKDAVFPVHPGAKAYYDNEEKTLMERYGDWLFYGPMLFGALGSIVVAGMRFLGMGQSPPDAVLRSKVGSMISSIHQTRTPAELDAIRDEIDQIVDRVAAEASTGGIDEQRLAALSLAINHIDRTLADQRATLLQRASSAARI